MRSIAHTLGRYCAIAFSGAMLLHGLIIAMIFHSLVFGGASTGEQQFCEPRDGPDGDLPFDDGPHSCDIQIPYTALAFLGGTFVTGVPLFLTMGVAGLVAMAFRALPTGWLSPFPDQSDAPPPWLSPLNGAIAAYVFSVDYPVRYYLSMAGFRQEFMVVLFMNLPIWYGVALTRRLPRLVRSMLAKA